MGKMLPLTLTYSEFSLVYNAISFVMASMGASTVYFFFHAHMVKKHYRTALCISGLVTGIAFYHYYRIFNSWNEAYSFPAVDANSDDYYPKATGIPFNDAYRYMDWLLTVPLLLIELILVMKLEDSEANSYSVKLGSAAALMIVLGYPGEVQSNLVVRGVFWVLAMLPFLYIIFVLIVGLGDAVDKQPEAAKSLVSQARYVTIISWLTYPVVYIIPLFGVSGTTAMVGIQIGYSISDFISKCVLGLMVTKIALAKTKAEEISKYGELDTTQIEV